MVSKKSYTVEFRRAVIEGLSIKVKASDAEEAKEKALQVLANDSSPDWETIEEETEVTDVYGTRR